MTEKKKIAVLGAGVMGVGIAQMFAAAGHEVKLIYVYDDKTRSRPVETMTANLTILRDEGVIKTGDIKLPDVEPAPVEEPGDGTFWERVRDLLPSHKK